MKALLLPISISVLTFAGFGQTQVSYRGEIEKWRSDHEAEIKKENGWLTVVGLFWLKEGKNSIDQGTGYDIELTDNFKFKPHKFGEIDFSGGKAVLTVADGVDAATGGKTVKTLELT